MNRELKNKGGRPKVNAANKKTVAITVRLTLVEYARLVSLAQKARSFAEFQALLSKNGISVSIKRSSKTNNAQGIIFTRGDYSIKGSKLDRSLGLGRIAKHFLEIRQAEQREAQRLHVPIQEPESRSEPKVRELAAGLFEGNLHFSEMSPKNPVFLWRRYFIIHIRLRTALSKPP